MKLSTSVCATLALHAACALFTPAVSGKQVLFVAAAAEIAAQAVLRRLAPHATSLRAFVFWAGSILNAQFLIHEIGHSLAAYALLRNASVRIELSPFQMGRTAMKIREATALGKWVGLRWIEPIVYAAGPLFSLGISAAVLSKGLSLKETEISQILVLSGAMDFCLHAIYALSALRADPADSVRDFAVLHRFGIHPLAAAAGIVSIAAAIYFTHRGASETAPRSKSES